MVFQNKPKNKKYSEIIENMGLNSFALKNMLSPVHLEMKSNREAVVEGCLGIEEYDENIVKIKMPKMGICFFGKKLEIKCMSVDSLVIEGVISSIEFSE